MAQLTEQLETTGNWLFRWRSYVPMALFVPLLVEMRHFDWPMHSHRLQFEWELCCLSVSFFGLAVRVLTVGFVPDGTSGRNTKSQVAVSLNTTGMYSVLRHPLYFGNFLIWLGIAMFSLDWRLLMIFALAFWLYYERIMLAEEAFLQRTFGEPFRVWAARTPAFLPRLSRWKSPSRSFSIKMVLRREYSALYGIIVMFFALDLLADWVVQKELRLEYPYLVMLLAGSAIYLMLRALKKRTRLLDVDAKCLAGDCA